MSPLALKGQNKFVATRCQALVERHAEALAPWFLTSPSTALG